MSDIIDFESLATRSDIRSMYEAPNAEQMQRSYECLCMNGNCSPDGDARHRSTGGGRGAHFCSNDRSFQALAKAGLAREHVVYLGRVSGGYSAYTLK
jgi:hypothetical protein